MLSRLGMGGVLDAPTDQLSGGQKKRVALAALLAREWDALILDEPTNHLDLDAIAYLEEWLAAFPGGLLLVTHDRHVLDRVTNKVLEIDRGATYLHVPHERTGGSGYAAYLAARIEREAQAATAEQTRKNLARRELAWLRRGAPARTSKPKARIDAANALLARGPAASAREGELGLVARQHPIGIEGRRAPRRRLLVAPARDDRRRPDRCSCCSRSTTCSSRAIASASSGPNGAGKSTLLDLMAGRLQPTQGSIEIGRTVKIGYYDQLGRDLDLTQRVRDAVAGGKGEPTLDDVKLMRQFWFDGDAQFAPISTLSGGERRRLQLLLTLIEQPNVLLLDEPTNDLDLDTLRALEEFLDDWPGIVVVVSHDRVFLDRTVSEVLALDGSGRAVVVRGGVAGWLAQHAARPHRCRRDGRLDVRRAHGRSPTRRLRRRSPSRRRARARCAISSRSSIASSPTRSRRATRCRPNSSPRAPTTRSWRASARSWPRRSTGSTPPRSAGCRSPTKPNRSAWRSESISARHRPTGW